MAEIETGILVRRCLEERIDQEETLTREAAAREAQCNATNARMNIRLMTDDARTRPTRLYLSSEV